MRGRDGSSVRTDRTDRADASSSKTSEKALILDRDMNKSAQASKKDETRKDDERSTVEDDARSDSHSVETQPVSAPTPVPIATQTINQEQIPTEEDPQSSKDEHSSNNSVLHVHATSLAVPPYLQWRLLRLTKTNRLQMEQFTIKGSTKRSTKTDDRPCRRILWRAMLKPGPI